MPTVPKPSSSAAPRGRDAVAVILAIGLATAVNLITIAVLYAAISGNSDVAGGISENGTQILTTAFGGIVGVLGGYVGGRAADRAAERARQNAVNGSQSDEGSGRA